MSSSESRAVVAMAVYQVVATLRYELLFRTHRKDTGSHATIAFVASAGVPGVVGVPSDCFAKFCADNYQRVVFVAAFLMKSCRSEVVLRGSEDSYYFLWVVQDIFQEICLLIFQLLQ